MKYISTAMIVSQFPNIVQTYINSGISGLQNNNVYVTVISSHKPNTKTPFSLKGKENPESIIYAEIDIFNLILSIFLMPIYSLSFWKLALGLISKGTIKKYGLKYTIKALVRIKHIHKNSFDILHSHNITLSYEFLFLKQLLSIPLITTFHGKEPRESKSLPIEKQQVLFKLGDCFLVNTMFAKNSLLELGCPEHKIKIIPQGTNIDHFPFKERQINLERDINIVTVGRLSIEKGQHIAIEAIHKLITKFPNIRYHLVGNGPEKNNLQALVKKLSLEKYVILQGYLSPNELNEIYSNSHIFILPSIDLNDGLHVETQGVAIQEAQASGMPVIASKTGGIPEILDNNITGILFNEKDSNDLAIKVERLISDESLYMNLKINGRKDVETRFNSLIIASKLREIYESF